MTHKADMALTHLGERRRTADELTGETTTGACLQEISAQLGYYVCRFGGCCPVTTENQSTAVCWKNYQEESRVYLQSLAQTAANPQAAPPAELA